jgi:hypothetical protein
MVENERAVGLIAVVLHNRTGLEDIKSSLSGRIMFEV